MALESSTKSKHRHARTLTPVIPVLPLSLTDKRWRRSTQLKDESQEIISSSEKSNLRSVTTSPAPESPAPISEAAQAESAQDILSEVKVKQATESIGLTADESLPVKKDEDVVTSAELKSQGNNEINEEVSTHMNPSNEPQATIGTDEPGNLRTVQLPDEESSEDLSSAVPSSTTAPTDYGQSLAESALETVLDDDTPRYKSTHHGKPSHAPEVNVNGASPDYQRPVNGSKSSRSILADPPPLLPIHEYLNYLSSSKEYSDTVIQLNQANKAYQPSLHTAHSLFLMRSDRLSKITQEYDQTLQSKVIHLYPARNVLPHAFEAAVRFFYADYVLTSQSLFPQTSLIEPHVRAQGFEYILSYWISGVELGLTPVKTRAFELMKEILDINMAEIVAKESRDLRSSIGGLSTKSTQDDVKEIADILSRFLAQMISSRVKDFKFTNDFAGNVLQPRFLDLDQRPPLSGVVFGSLPNQPSSP